MRFSTLDELASWMLTNIRLSRYDDQFVNNLTLYITTQKRITSNQDTLFKKVASKYNRQFLHHKIKIEDELKLSWSVGIVPSLPEYTGATIKIENGKIIFRSPYNKEFLTALRKKAPYNLTWHKDLRQYEATYSPNTLKDLIYLSADHFTVLNYCDVVTQIINSLSVYESIKYWVPTLVYNRGYYITACNEQVHEATKHIELSDNLQSIAQLVKYGVTIDQSAKDHLNKSQDPEKVNFASSFQPIIEVRDIKKVFSWLEELGCDAINETRNLLFNSKLDIDPYLGKMKLCKTTKLLGDYQNPVSISMRGGVNLFEFKPIKMFKIIKIVNSEPINLGPK